MENNTFVYNYSAADNKEIMEIRSKYLPKAESKLDELKKLDRKVKKPARVFGYIFGAISAVVMGAGMSLVMTDIGSVLGMTETMIPGIAIGLVGIAMALLNYPVSRGILNARRKKFSGKIIELSDSIVNGESVSNG